MVFIFMDGFSLFSSLACPHSFDSPKFGFSFFFLLPPLSFGLSVIEILSHVCSFHVALLPFSKANFIYVYVYFLIFRRGTGEIVIICICRLVWFFLLYFLYHTDARITFHPFIYFKSKREWSKTASNYYSFSSLDFAEINFFSI